MKKIERLIAILSIILFLSLCPAVALVYCNGAQSEAQNTEITIERYDQAADGYATVYVPQGKNLRVLTLADPQIDSVSVHAYAGCDTAITMRLIKELVQAVNPDMVIIVGDLCISRVFNNWSYMKTYCELFEELNVFWAPLFGNHDSQKDCVEDANTIDDDFGQITKEKLVPLMRAYPHCLISEGDAATYGEHGGLGNYFVNVKNYNNELLYTFCLFDTVSRDTISEDDYWYYQPKTETQLTWYASHISALSDSVYGTDRSEDEVIKSMAFMHVQPYQAHLGWEAAFDSDGQPNSNYFYGNKFGGIYEDCYRFGEVAEELGSTEAVFFGHLHDNDFSVNYNGIRYTSVQHSGWSAEYRFSRNGNNFSAAPDFSMTDTYGDNRGGTLITLSFGADHASSYTVTQQFARELIPSYTSWAYKVYVK